MVRLTAGVSLGVLCCARNKTKTSVKNQHGFQRLSDVLSESISRRRAVAP